MDFFINGINAEPIIYISNSSGMPRSYSRVRWSQQEDETLIKHVSKNGTKKWKQIAIELKTKTAQQCRDHYFNVLDPNISNALWTDEEERILLSKYEQFGNHWTQIKKFLPGRTTNMIKNNLNLLLKKGSEKKINKDKENSDLYNPKTSNAKSESQKLFYFNIESLLNHTSNFALNSNSIK